MVFLLTMLMRRMRQNSRLGWLPREESLETSETKNDSIIRLKQNQETPLLTPPISPSLVALKVLCTPGRLLHMDCRGVGLTGSPVKLLWFLVLRDEKS